MEQFKIAIPGEIDNLALPDPSLLQFYKDVENRVIWIEGEIDENITDFTKLILKWNKEDINVPVETRKPIKVFISSPGGVLEDTLALVSLIGISKTPVWTINAGWAYSAACLIALSGHKRFALPGTSYLLHSGSGGTCGTYDQTKAQQKQYDAIVNRMWDFIKSHTTIDQKVLNKYKKDDWYISLDEAIKFGMVDKLVDNLDEIL